jgi:hypothetical protein
MRFLARVLSQHWPPMSQSTPREHTCRGNRVIEARDILIDLPSTSRRTAELRTRQLIAFEAQAQGLRKPGIGLPFASCRLTHPSFRLQVQVRDARDDSNRMPLQRVHVCAGMNFRYEVDLCRPRVAIRLSMPTGLAPS